MRLRRHAGKAGFWELGCWGWLAAFPSCSWVNPPVSLDKVGSGRIRGLIGPREAEDERQCWLLSAFLCGLGCRLGLGSSTSCKCLEVNIREGQGSACSLASSLNVGEQLVWLCSQCWTWVLCLLLRLSYAPPLLGTMATGSVLCPGLPPNQG